MPLPPASPAPASASLPAAPGTALTLQVSDTKTTTVSMPLRAGLYEQLPERQQFELATFLASKTNAHTHRCYVAQLEKFLLWMGYAGHTDLRHLDEWWLRDYQAVLFDPPATLRGRSDIVFNPLREEAVDDALKPVKIFVTYLHDKRFLDYNPGKHLANLAVADAEADPIKMPDDEQWAIIRQTLDWLPIRTLGQRNRAERLRCGIDVGYALALRVSEQVSHGHHDIVPPGTRRNQPNWAIGIVGKGRKRRWLSLAGNSTDDLALEALCRYRNFLGLPEYPADERLPLLPAKVPVVRRAGLPLQIKTRSIAVNTWYEHFTSFIRVDVMTYLYGDDEATKAHEYAARWDYSPHCLRHRRLTDLAMKYQKPLAWAQQFAGHSDPKTTAVYFHPAL